MKSSEIRLLRKKFNISQLDLCSLTGINQSNLSDIESEKTSPTEKTLLRIERTFSVLEKVKKPPNLSFNWNDDKIIDFLNWYLELHKIDSRFNLENKSIIESFKNAEN